MMKKNVINGVKEVMQEMFDRDGHVTSKALVDAARPEHSPAHAGFEWRNKIAGENWRIHQARNYIRKINIRYEEQDVPLYHVPKVRQEAAGDDDDMTRDGYYAPAQRIIQQPDEYQQAIGQLQRHLGAVRRSLGYLMDVARKQPDSDDRSAIVGQLARALDLMEEALTRH